MSDLNMPGDDDLIDSDELTSSEERLADDVGRPAAEPEGPDGDLEIGPALAPPD